MNNTINWQKLAQINELKPYFEANFSEFQLKIENHLTIWQKIGE